jgi:hypothetical protein
VPNECQGQAPVPLTAAVTPRSSPDSRRRHCRAQRQQRHGEALGAPPRDRIAWLRRSSGTASSGEPVSVSHRPARRPGNAAPSLHERLDLADRAARSPCSPCPLRRAFAADTRPLDIRLLDVADEVAGSSRQASRGRRLCSWGLSQE